MTNEPLKPCPFCGGEAVYTSRANSNQSGWQHDVDHWVYCDSDGLCSANQGMYEYRTEAIAAWNTRADIHQVVFLEIEELQDRLTTARNDVLDEVEGWFVDHSNGTALALFRAMRKNNPPAL